MGHVFLFATLHSHLSCWLLSSAGPEVLKAAPIGPPLSAHHRLPHETPLLFVPWKSCDLDGINRPLFLSKFRSFWVWEMLKVSGPSQR